MKLSRHFIQFAVFESTIIFESWSNFMAQYASVHEGTQYTLWSSSTLIIFLSVQSVQLHPSKCVFFFLFVCQSLEEPVVSPATSSHTFACLFLFLFFLCVFEQQKTLMIDYWCVTDVQTVPCMLDMYGSFLCLKMSFCRMTPAWYSFFIYGLFTFLGQRQKSDRTSLPPMLWTQAHFCCVEVRATAHGGCTVRSMHCMELNGMDPLKDTPSPIRNVSVSESLCRL